MPCPLPALLVSTKTALQCSWIPQGPQSQVPVPCPLTTAVLALRCASQACSQRGQGSPLRSSEPHSLESPIPLPPLPTELGDKLLTRRNVGFALSLPALSSLLHSLLSVSSALAGDGAAISSREALGAEAAVEAREGNESLLDERHCTNNNGPFQYRVLRGVFSLASGVTEEQAIGLQILVPLDGSSMGDPRLPLAIFSGGFGLDSAKYESYTRALATSGFVSMSYDERAAARVASDDLSRAKLLSSLIDWCDSSDDLNGLVDVDSVYLCGHSRGAKLSILAAALDPRVVSLGLLDPVDNTDYAPLALGYPSAVAVMEAGRNDSTGESTYNSEHSQELKAQGLSLNAPSLIVGAGFQGDCAPRGSNYPEFFQAASSPSWQITIRQAGHLQFVQDPPVLQNSVCGFGNVRDDDVRLVAETVLVAWGLATVIDRRRASPSDNTLDASMQTCLRSSMNMLNDMLPDLLQYAFF